MGFEQRVVSASNDWDASGIADGEIVRWDASAGRYKRASGLTLAATGTLGLTRANYASPTAVGTGIIHKKFAKLADGGQLVDFNWVSLITDIAAETVDNWVMGWGSNISTSFGQEVAGQHATCWAIEERFKQGSDWLTETMFRYTNAGNTQKRPIAVYINLATDYTEWLNQCDSFQLRETSSSAFVASAWFSATASSLTYAGTSNLTTIQFPNTTADKINLYSTTFGIGIAASELVAWFGNGSKFGLHLDTRTGTEVFSVNSSGNVIALGTINGTTLTGSTAVNGGTVSGTTVSASTAFRAAVGSVSAPGLSYTGNTNYGFYVVSSGISTAIAGVRKMFVDGSGLGLDKIRRMTASTIAEWAVDEGTNAIGLALYYTGAKANSSGTFSLLNVGSGAGTQFGTASWTGTGGTFRGIAIEPIYNQASGTAANTDLYINRTQTAVGSGTQRFIDACVGGTSYFSVSNTGAVIISTTGTKQIETNATGIGFYAATPVAKQTVTGSRGSNAALADLLTKLATLGLITDSTS
jgi:hypothetical protein